MMLPFIRSWKILPPGFRKIPMKTIFPVRKDYPSRVRRCKSLTPEFRNMICDTRDKRDTRPRLSRVSRRCLLISRPRLGECPREVSAGFGLGIRAGQFAVRFHLDKQGAGFIRAGDNPRPPPAGSASRPFTPAPSQRGGGTER
jgi:hypothetical protein